MAALLFAGGLLGVNPAGAGGEWGPVMNVSPDTGLVDGQLVEVSGAGWRPYELVAVAVCDDRGLVSITNCDPSTAGAASVDERGVLVGSLNVRRRITTEAGVEVDCRPSHCAVGAITMDASGNPQLVKWSLITFTAPK